MHLNKTKIKKIAAIVGHFALQVILVIVSKGRRGVK